MGEGVSFTLSYLGISPAVPPFFSIQAAKGCDRRQNTRRLPTKRRLTAPTTVDRFRGVA
jgi:hypothetical protein